MCSLPLQEDKCCLIPQLKPVPTEGGEGGRGRNPPEQDSQPVDEYQRSHEDAYMHAHIIWLERTSTLVQHLHVVGLPTLLVSSPDHSRAHTQGGRVVVKTDS